MWMEIRVGWMVWKTRIVRNNIPMNLSFPGGATRWCHLLVVGLALAGCASTPPVAPAPATTAALEGDALRPASANGRVRSELYFGVGEETGPADRPQA